MADISLVLRVRTSAGTRRNNSQKYGKKQQDDNSEGDICYFENICRAGQTLTYNIEDELNIDAGNKHVLAMFLN